MDSGPFTRVMHNVPRTEFKLMPARLFVGNWTEKNALEKY